MDRIPLTEVKIAGEELYRRLKNCYTFRTKRQQFFDAARKAGYADAEISEFLKVKENFDAVYKQRVYKK